MITKENAIKRDSIVSDFEPNILIKAVHLTNFDQNCSIKSFFSY